MYFISYGNSTLLSKLLTFYNLQIVQVQFNLGNNVVNLLSHAMICLLTIQSKTVWLVVVQVILYKLYLIINKHNILPST